MHRWALHGTIRSVSEYQYYTILPRCYLTSDVSTPVFTQCCIIVCDGKVSNEVLLVKSITELIPVCTVGCQKC